jgi:phosphonate transport system permease protein
MTTPTRLPPQELKPSLVPPVVATLLSLIVPGLGHILARAYQRGVLLILSTFSILGLMTWRFRTVGRRETELIEIIRKGYRLEPLLIVSTIIIIILYLWIVVDTYRFASRTASTSIGPFVIVLFAFFILGWQIGDIDLGLLAREVGKARYRLTQIMWPWDRAISRAPEEIQGIQIIEVPCSESPPSPSTQTPDEPWLIANPTCGQLSEQEGPPGTLLTLHGGNMLPNTEAEILWEDPLGNEFRQRQEGEYLTIITDENGSFQIDVVMPYRLIPSSAAPGTKTWQVKARQIESYGKAEPSRELTLAIGKMIETIFLGMMATFFGIILALPLSFLAAKNLMSSSKVTLAIYYLMRTILNIVRSVEPLIWAVIAVAVVGLGPFAGIVALTLHSIAALGKLYSEAIESINPGPIEAVLATGANWPQMIMYAVVPQIIPPFVSFTIYRWDINVRMSTVIGLVGGGGIGLLLVQWMKLLDFKAAGIAVWFIVVTVAVLDFVSASIRERFV